MSTFTERGSKGLVAAHPLAPGLKVVHGGGQQPRERGCDQQVVEPEHLLVALVEQSEGVVPSVDAGSWRLRQVINKLIREEDLFGEVLPRLLVDESSAALGRSWLLADYSVDLER